MDCGFVLIFLCLGLSSGQSAEVKSYSVSLLRNGRSSNFSRTSEFNNNNNNRSTDVAQTAHRSVVNVLEEKQQMLESDLSKLKEHLTKLEWKVEGLQGHRKHTEKATEDIKWAVGSLKKSVLNIENDVVQFKLSQKNSVTSSSQGHDLMTSLQKKVTALEEDNRRKEAEIKQMWTLVRSLSEDKNDDVRHHHHHHNQQEKHKSTNLLTGNEIPSPPSSSSSSSFSPVVGEQWVARLMSRLASIEGAVQDLNRRQQIDKRNLAEQEELLLEKFDQLQEKMLRMKDEIHDLEDGKKTFGTKELRCFTKTTGANSVNTSSSSKDAGEEMEVLLKDLSDRSGLANLWRRMEAVEGKILVLQLNSTVNQSRDVNHDLKMRLDLAHVAFQASELTNQMFLFRSTVNRISRELKLLKETTNNFQVTNQIPG